METLKLYTVGGCVRDEILGHPTKDVDFAVESPDFQTMVDFIEAEGHRIVETRQEFLTVRAVVGKDHPLRQQTNAADFVMCRKDSATGDGRRPDFVVPGTILDDLARRDLTINAMAKDMDGNLLDPYDGRTDIQHRRIRFVGDPMDRIREDGLRVLRALRFGVTKDFVFVPETWEALGHPLSAEMLDKVSTERIREEVQKMFVADTMRSMRLLSVHFPELADVIFVDGLHLEASLKTRG